MEKHKITTRQQLTDFLHANEKVNKPYDNPVIVEQLDKARASVVEMYFTDSWINNNHILK